MTTAYKPRVKYSFDVYPVPIFGTGFQRVTVQAVVDYQTAMGFADVAAIQRNVYSFLPVNTPDRPQDYDYLLLRTESGDTTVLAVPWINDATVVVVQNLTAMVKIDNLQSSADIEAIRACLSQNGFNDISIELVS